MMNEIKPKIHEEESLFVKVLTKYLTYWPLFLVFLMLAGGLAYVYLLYTNPKYQATASLIIKDEKKGDEDAKIMESLNMLSTKKIIENEVEVLQSRQVIAKVVNKLHLYAPIYRKGKFTMLPAYEDAPVSIECEHPDSIVGTKEKVLISYDTSKAYVLLNNKYVCATNQWVRTPYGSLKFVPNTKFNGSLQEPYYFSLVEPDIATKIIQGNLDVSAINKLSSVINLQYKDERPRLAKDVLNEIIVAYNNINIKEKNDLATNTLTFIEARLNVVGADLSAIEQKIQQYKANSGAVDISTQGQLFLHNVSENDQKLSDVNMQLSVINQLEKQISANDDNVGILPTSLGVNDQVLTQLMNSLYTSEQEKEKLKKTVAENNPILISVTDQISKTKRNILDHIQNQRRNLETSKSTIFATNSNYTDMLHNIPVKERELLEISRDQTIKSGIYSFLLQKREESELSFASNLSNSRIVNYSEASNIPVSPNKMLVIVISIIAALAIPIGFINAREAFNPTILYRQEIEALTAIPIIGEVAYNKSTNQVVVEPGKRSFIAEEFRKIRFSLHFLGINATHKKVLITSGISGEGKSFIAANLAISYSLTGKKVVLVDLDLHNSSLGKIFNKEQEAGVSDYLMEDKTASEIVNPLANYENLYFVPSGSIKDNLSERLENGRVQQLITYLENRFDVIIIDSEPVELVTDAHLLSHLCDATLYVIRHMYTPKMLLKRFDQNNAITPLTNPGILFNGVKTRGYLKNTYGYGYGYVYGDKELTKKDKKKAKAQV